MEPSKPLYGMPPPGSAAAPPPSSTPAYIFSHQYQRECFTRTCARLPDDFPPACKKYLPLNPPKNKSFGTKPFIFISLFLLLWQTRNIFIWRFCTLTCFDRIFFSEGHPVCVAWHHRSATHLIFSGQMMSTYITYKEVGSVRDKCLESYESYEGTVNLIYLFYTFWEASHPQQEWFSPPELLDELRCISLESQGLVCVLLL